MTPIPQDPAYSRLKSQLIEQTGLAFYADRDEALAGTIGERLLILGLHDCSSYIEFLTAESGTAEMEILIAKLTIGETYFFRDERQFTAIRDHILPEILKRNHSSKHLRIWSAGCATGAEPYSLAILLMRELADQISGWRVEIHATDLNRNYLAQAAMGKFRAWALRSTSDEVKGECFRHEGLVWTIDPRFKQWISFRHMNLVESEFITPFPSGTHFDLILCRNVMIYFTQEVSRRLVGQFHGSLCDGGWLVVGASEYSLVNEKDFSVVDASGAKVYRKVPPLLEISGEILQIKGKVPRPATTFTPPAAPPANSPPVRDCGNLDALRQLADRGDWQNAAECSLRLLTRDRLNPEIHFYRGLILENLGNAGESERSLRQAIYLDRNFGLAHYHLALALKRDGRIEAAGRSFGNVLKIMAATPDLASVMAAPGVTAIELKELAKMHLKETRES